MSQVACTTPIRQALGGRADRAAVLPTSHLPSHSRGGITCRRVLARSYRLKWALAVATLSALATGGLAPVTASADRAASVEHAAGPRSLNGVPLPKVAERVVSMTDASTEDLFAVGAGKQVVAVGRVLDLPEGGADHQAVGLRPQRRGDRDLPTRSGRDLGQHPPHRLPARRAAHPGAAPAGAGRIWTVPTHRCRTSAPSPATARRRGRLVRALEAPGRDDRAVGEANQTADHRLSRARIRPSTPPARGRSSGRSTRCSGLRNIADKAPKAAAYPQLSSRVHRLRGSRPDRPGRHRLLRPVGEDGREAARLERDQRGQETTTYWR